MKVEMKKTFDYFCMGLAYLGGAAGLVLVVYVAVVIALNVDWLELWSTWWQSIVGIVFMGFALYGTSLLIERTEQKARQKRNDDLDN